jgi:hypothetical protein
MPPNDTLDQQISQAILLEDEAERERRLIRLLEQKRQSYVDARANELISSAPFTGTPEEAQAQAMREYEEDYLVPLQNVYGELPEKVFRLSPLIGVPAAAAASVPASIAAGEVGYVAEPAPPMNLPTFGQPPSFMTALQPQSVMTPEMAAREKDRVAVESGIDFARLEELLKEEEGLPEADASLQRRAIQRAYEEVKRKNPTIPPNEVFTFVLDQLAALPEAMENPSLTDTQAQQQGAADALYQTFVRQRDAGEPVPDLTPAQMAYFNYIYNNTREEARQRAEERLQGTTIPYVRLDNGDELPEAQFMQLRQTNPEYSGLSFTRFEKPRTEQQIRDLALRESENDFPNIWWADPEKKPEVLANPEAFNTRGIFYTTTPFGGTIETPVGWTLRSALTIPNLVAGAGTEYAVMPALGALYGEDLRAARRERRAEETPLYVDNPVLLNVAQNRGFTMEMNEAADLLEMGATGKAVMTAGGFALDLLDPTLGLIGGGATGLKTTLQVNKASKAIYNAPRMSRYLQAGTAGARDAGAYFLRDFNVVSILPEAGGIARTGRRGTANRLADQLAYGDVRTAMGADLTSSLIARDIAKRESDVQAALTAMNREGVGNSSYARQFESLANSGGDYATLVGRMDNFITAVADEGGAGLVRAIDDYDGVMRSLDEVADQPLDASVRLGKNVDELDLARNIGAIAKQDDTIEALLRQADATAPAGRTNKLGHYLRTMKSQAPAAYAKLRNQFAYDRALGYVYENTKSIKGFDDLRMVTKNTWANKTQAAKLLEHIRDKTAIGKIAKQLVEKEVPIISAQSGGGLTTRADQKGKLLGAREAATQSYFDLTDVKPDIVTSVKGNITSTTAESIANKLIAITKKLQDYGKLSSKKAADIIADLTGKGAGVGGQRLISTADFRLLLESTTDLVAEGQQVATRGRDIARLPPSTANAILEPLEVRSFGSQVFKDWFKSAITGAGEVIGRAITPQQRALIRGAQQEASNLDTKLRKLVAAMRKDKATQELYGVVGDVSVATNHDLLAYAIVGERQFDETRDLERAGARLLGRAVQENVVEDGLNWTIRRLFFSKRIDESLLDAFLGTKKVFQEDFLSGVGREKLDEAIKAAARRVIDAPETYWKEVNNLIGEMRVLIQDPENLLPLVKPQNIFDVVATKKGKIPAEVQVGSYYWNETNRIMTRKIDELLTSDPDLERFFISQTKDLEDKLQVVTGRASLDQLAAGFFPDIVKARAASLAADLDYNVVQDFTGLLEEAYARVGGIPNKPQAIADIAILREVSEELDLAAKEGRAADAAILGKTSQIPYWEDLLDVIDRADEAARHLLRRNGVDGFDFSNNYKAATAAIEELLGKNNENYVAAVIGKAPYEELQGAIKQGKVDGFTRYVDAALRAATGTKDLIRVKDSILYLMREINNLRYTFLLTMRPRFSATNVSTAPWIVYSTIGQNTGLFEIGKGIIKGNNIVRNGWNRNRVGYLKPAVVAPDGRIYTNGELLDALTNAGIRSEYGFITDVATQQRIINWANSKQFFTHRKGGKVVLSGQSPLTTTGQAAQDFITAQDLTFRAGVAARALEEGRSLDEAVNLARRSLFDYAEMSDIERAIAGYAFIFYSFARQNLATLLRASVDPTKMKRYANILKTDRGLQAMANSMSNTEPPPEQFFPDYTRARQLLYKLEPKGRRDIYVASPNIPAIDAMVMLASLAKSGGAQELIRNQLHPNVEAALGLEGFPKNYKQLSPEHIAYVRLMYGDDSQQVADFFARFLGGNITPVASTDETAVGGYIYPLSPEQQTNYENYDYWVMGWTGLGSLTTDYARTIGAEGTPQAELSTLERAFYSGFPQAAAAAASFTPLGRVGVGAAGALAQPLTPMRMTRPTSASASDIYARISAIQERLKQIDREEKKER